MAFTEIEESPIQLDSEDGTRKRTNPLGICGIIIGILAWILVYVTKWAGIICAVVGLILSCFGIKGRFPNLAIGGTIISAVLLIVIAVIEAMVVYVVQSI